MTETAQEYIQRLHRTLGDREPLQSLESMLTEMESLRSQVNNPRFRTAAPGKWSGAQILSHLAEGEIAYSWRLRSMLANSGTDISSFDQDAWVANSTYLQELPQLAFDLFVTMRKANLAMLKSLPAEKWNCFGVHSERGRESIADLTKLTAGHDLNHLKQIKALL